MSEAACKSAEQSLVALLRAKGLRVYLSPSGALCVGPRTKLTIAVREWINKAHPLLIEELLEEPVESVIEVLEIAREVLPVLEDEDRVDLQELLRAKKLPERGRDSMVKKGTDKANFFIGDWRGCGPPGFKVHRPEGGLP